MRFYGFEEFDEDVKMIAKELSAYGCDTIVAVARGGMTFGHFLAEYMHIRELYCLNSVHYDDQKKLDYIKIFNIPDLSKSKKTVVVDDIIDSGETMQNIIALLQEKFPNTEFKTASIFYKSNSIVKPDFSVKEAKKWIRFFWAKSKI